MEEHQHRHHYRHHHRHHRHHHYTPSGPIPNMEPENHQGAVKDQGGDMEWNKLGETDHGVAEEAPEHSPANTSEPHHLEDDNYRPLLEPVLASERPHKYKRFQNAGERRNHMYGTAIPKDQRKTRYILKKAEQLVKEGRVRKTGPKPSDLPQGNWTLGQDGKLKEKKSAPNPRQKKAFRNARTMEKAEKILKDQEDRQGMRKFDGVDCFDSWRPGRDGRFGDKVVFSACNADGSELPARKIEWSQDD